MLQNSSIILFLFLEVSMLMVLTLFTNPTKFYDLSTIYLTCFLVFFLFNGILVLELSIQNGSCYLVDYSPSKLDLEWIIGLLLGTNKHPGRLSTEINLSINYWFY